MLTFKEFLTEGKQDVFSVRVSDGQKFNTYKVSAKDQNQAKEKAVKMFKKKQGVSGGTPKADNVRLVKANKLHDSTGNLR